VSKDWPGGFRPASAVYRPRPRRRDDLPDFADGVMAWSLRSWVRRGANNRIPIRRRETDGAVPINFLANGLTFQ